MYECSEHLRTHQDSHNTDGDTGFDCTFLGRRTYTHHQCTHPQLRGSAKENTGISVSVGKRTETEGSTENVESIGAAAAAKYGKERDHNPESVYGFTHSRSSFEDDDKCSFCVCCSSCSSLSQDFLPFLCFSGFGSVCRVAGRCQVGQVEMGKLQ